MKYKSANHGLTEKVKSARNKGLIFIEIIESKIKNDSSLSIMNIIFCSKLPLPMRHRKNFKTISRKPKYVERVCIDRKNSLHFAYPKCTANLNLKKNVIWVKTDLSFKSDMVIVSVNVFGNIAIKYLFSRPF